MFGTRAGKWELTFVRDFFRPPKHENDDVVKSRYTRNESEAEAEKYSTPAPA